MSDATAARKGVTIYRAADAVDLQKTDMMLTPTMSDETKASLGEVLSAGSAPGAQVKVLMRQTPDEGGISLLHCWFQSGYPLARHSHDSDCMYYVISGEAHLGNQVLRAGDSFFVPADAPYVYSSGPDGVEVLEIRYGCDKFDMKIPDAPAARWKAALDAVVEHRDEWAAKPDSPTFAANRT